MTNEKVSVSRLSSAQAVKTAVVAFAFATMVLASFASPLAFVNVEAALLPSDVAGDALNSQGKAVPDLDIKMAGFAGSRAYIQVYGTAGGTVADHEHAIAYVVAVITDSGEAQTWAIDSHEKQHGDSGTGSAWHAHRVHLGDNPHTAAVEYAGCVNEVDQVNHAMMDGNRVYFENMVVKGSNGNPETVKAVEITAALTVELHVLVDDPDNPPAGTPCIAEVSWLFDAA